MAIVTATAFKAAAALAAVELTTAWTDDTVTHTALEIRNPSHPLRDLENMFILDASTGVVTANDAAIDAAYAGNMPSLGSTLDVVTDWLPLALTTATVETAAPTDIVLTFSRDVANYSNVIIGGAASAGKSIVSVTIVDAVVTIVVSAAYIAADVITVSGDFRTADSAILVLSSEAVTNNVV